MNRNKYAYVLAASPKYTIMLVPLIVLMISANFKKLLEVCGKLRESVMVFLLCVLIVLGISLQFRTDWYLGIFESIAPIIRDKVYYSSKLSELGLILVLVSIILTVTYIYIRWISRRVSLASVNLMVILVLFFATPFALTLNSNFGWMNIYQNFWRSRETKLTQTKVEGSFYKTMNEINGLSDNNNMLLIGQNFYPVSYYWKGDDNRLFDISSLDEVKKKNKDMDFKTWLVKEKINYVFTKDEPLIEGKPLSSWPVILIYSNTVNRVYRVL
jgi:hypothetical protein